MSQDERDLDKERFELLKEIRKTIPEEVLKSIETVEELTTCNEYQVINSSEGTGNADPQ